jgi:hypothetical protein
MLSPTETKTDADALSKEEQQALLQRLNPKLSFKVGSKLGQFPRPPDVPIEELRRIESIIESEFSKVDSSGS